MNKAIIFICATLMFTGVAQALQQPNVNLDVYSKAKAESMSNAALSWALSKSTLNASLYCSITLVNYIHDRTLRATNAADSVATDTMDKTPRQMGKEISKEMDTTAVPSVLGENEACRISFANFVAISDVLMERGQMTAEEKAEFDKMEKPVIIAP